MSEKLFRPQDYPLPHDYTDHDWLWCEARKASDKRREESHKRDQWIKADIERRRERVRHKQMVACDHIRALAPDRTDMTFWLTMVGPRPQIGVTPEEERGLRTKTVGEVERDKNGFHVRARKGLVYWPKLATSACLSKPLSGAHPLAKNGARADRLTIKTSDDLGSFKPDWKKITF